jgi:hypothetical protein
MSGGHVGHAGARAHLGRLEEHALLALAGVLAARAAQRRERLLELAEALLRVLDEAGVGALLAEVVQPLGRLRDLRAQALCARRHRTRTEGGQTAHRSIARPKRDPRE